MSSALADNTSQAWFSLTKYGEPQWRCPLGAESSSSVFGHVKENGEYGFEVSPRESETEYRILIGDLEPEAPHGKKVSQLIGVHRGNLAQWDDARHFESARRRVTVSLSSRNCDSAAAWKIRAEALCYVIPSKLTEDSYQRMCDQLQAAISGLIFDLLSKSQTSVALTSRSGISSQPSNVELLAIESVWRSVSSALHAINELPSLRLSAEFRLQRCWGTERLNPHSFNGRAPMLGGRHATLPFVALARRPVETIDTPEHRFISWFLNFLESRVRSCQLNAQSHIAAIQAEREFWIPRTQSLYQKQDAPRIARLQEASARAEELREMLKSARNLSFLSGVQPQIGSLRSPVFDNVTPYYRLASAAREYLHSSFYVLEEGSGERLKPTHLMYEQWVFVQLALALKAGGLVCDESTAFFRRLPGQRFTADFVRDTTLSFRHPRAGTVKLRYEPSIHPKAVAQRLEAILYREGFGWPLRPDFVIEFWSNSQDLLEVIILDAKYTQRIKPHHWEKVDAYWTIRSVVNSELCVRRLWLVYAGNERAGPVNFEDEQGELPLRPSEKSNPNEPDDTPEPAARAFIDTALKLARFDVRPADL
jgi:hypothetical protein